jgi:hypothetical protein
MCEKGEEVVKVKMAFGISSVATLSINKLCTSIVITFLFIKTGGI